MDSNKGYLTVYETVPGEIGFSIDNKFAILDQNEIKVLIAKLRELVEVTPVTKHLEQV